MELANADVKLINVEVAVAIFRYFLSTVLSGFLRGFMSDTGSEVFLSYSFSFHDTRLYKTNGGLLSETFA